MFVLITFIPKGESEKVIEKIFASGAGKYKNYDRCGFLTEGIGRFRPLDNSNPFIGSKNKDEFVHEIRFETIVSDEKVEEVIKVLRENHPYEEPAIYLIKLSDLAY